MVARAIDEAAWGFWERYNFLRSPLGKRMMLNETLGALAWLRALG